jgi:hypothetical protein
MRLAALGFGLGFVLGFLLLFRSAHFRTLIFIGIRFRLAGGSSFPAYSAPPCCPHPCGWWSSLPLIDLLLPLLFDSSLDFLEEGSPKRIARKSLSFSKRDKSLWAGDCVGSNLRTVISGVNGLSVLAEKDKSPFLFLDIDDNLLLVDFVYFGGPEPLVDNTLAFFRFLASSHTNHGIRVEVSPE